MSTLPEVSGTTDNTHDLYGYMTVHHPDAFLGLPVLESPVKEWFLCFKCRGHGKWNLSLDPVHLCTCDSCSGYGWTFRKETHEHVWSTEEIGKCLRRDTCVVCGKVTVLDSSD